MGHPAKVAEFNAQDYLAWESARADKNEFLRGEVFAMVGATRKHVTVAGNVFRLLSNALQGSSCRAYISDMKLRIEAADAFFYPDVLVTCNAKDHEADAYMVSAVLIVEVLSLSTEAYDRGEKFAAYRKVPTLREYLLIDPESRRVEIYRASTEGQWVLTEVDLNGTLPLTSVDIEVPVQQLFENV
jgi:Uma2 family endonuclease